MLISFVDLHHLKSVNNNKLLCVLQCKLRPKKINEKDVISKNDTVARRPNSYFVSMFSSSSPFLLLLLFFFFLLFVFSFLPISGLCQSGASPAEKQLNLRHRRSNDKTVHMILVFIEKWGLVAGCKVCILADAGRT